MKHPAYEKTLDCVHCGLCLPHCPTYRVTGREADSPRGRIYLMRGWSEGAFELTDTTRQRLDECIVCRACESVCPSGIHMGEMIETYRSVDRRERPNLSFAARWTQKLMNEVLPRRDRIALLSDLLWLHQRSGLGWLTGAILGAASPRLARLHALQPRIPSRSLRRVATDRTIPVHAAEGKRRARVGLFLGCIASEWFAQVHHAAVRVLTKNGVEVVVPDAQTCCGALHRHAGDLDEAAKLHGANARVFEAAGVDAVLTTAAGCGASLREPPPNAPSLPKTQDIAEFLSALGMTAPLRALSGKVTIDHPCHLIHGQRVSGETVEGLIARIPGITLVPLSGSDRCCGAGGIYNLHHADMADAVLEDKAASILATGAGTVLTGNPGCAMQIRQGLVARGRASIEVLHPVEFLNRAIV